MSPVRSHVLPENLLLCGLISTGSSSFQEPAPTQALHRLQLLSGHIHLLWRKVLHGLQLDVCSTMVLHGQQWDNLYHHGLHHGLQGNLCSDAWTTYSTCFFTDLGVCRVVSLTYSHSSLTGIVAQPFLTLRYAIRKASPASLIGSALASSGSILELAGMDSVQHQGTSCFSLT